MEDMLVKKAMNNFEGKFWTRKTEMERDIWSHGYEIIDSSYEHVVIVGSTDDDEIEITLRIGHANGTMWVKEVL